MRIVLNFSVIVKHYLASNHKDGMNNTVTYVCMYSTVQYNLLVADCKPYVLFF